MCIRDRLQGARDEIVPASVSTVAAWQDRESGTPRFVDVAGAGHFSLIDPTSSVWPVVLVELEALVERDAQTDLP